jgi:hypothetical protein
MNDWSFGPTADFTRKNRNYNCLSYKAHKSITRRTWLISLELEAIFSATAMTVSTRCQCYKIFFFWPRPARVFVIRELFQKSTMRVGHQLKISLKILPWTSTRSFCPMVTDEEKRFIAMAPVYLPERPCWPVPFFRPPPRPSECLGPKKSEL